MEIRREQRFSNFFKAMDKFQQSVDYIKYNLMELTIVVV